MDRAAEYPDSPPLQVSAPALQPSSTEPLYASSPVPTPCPRGVRVACARVRVYVEREEGAPERGHGWEALCLGAAKQNRDGCRLPSSDQDVGSPGPALQGLLTIALLLAACPAPSPLQQVVREALRRIGPAAPGPLLFPSSPPHIVAPSQHWQVNWIQEIRLCSSWGYRGAGSWVEDPRFLGTFSAIGRKEARLLGSHPSLWAWAQE